MSGKGDKPRKVGPEFYKNFDGIFKKRRGAPRRKRPLVVESEPVKLDPKRLMALEQLAAEGQELDMGYE